jgi:hypothetical protein
MANKVAEKQVRFRVTANITVPAGTMLPNSITLKKAFQNGLHSDLSFEHVKVGELRYEQLVPPTAGKTKEKGKKKPKPKPKPKKAKASKVSDRETVVAFEDFRNIPELKKDE